jgi:hypothetical protein
MTGLGLASRMFQSIGIHHRERKTAHHSLAGGRGKTRPNFSVFHSFWREPWDQAVTTTSSSIHTTLQYLWHSVLLISFYLFDTQLFSFNQANPEIRP